MTVMKRINASHLISFQFRLSAQMQILIWEIYFKSVSIIFYYFKKIWQHEYGSICCIAKK